MPCNQQLDAAVDQACAQQTHEAYLAVLCMLQDHARSLTKATLGAALCRLDMVNPPINGRHWLESWSDALMTNAILFRENSYTVDGTRPWHMVLLLSVAHGFEQRAKQGNLDKGTRLGYLEEAEYLGAQWLKLLPDWAVGHPQFVLNMLGLINVPTSMSGCNAIERERRAVLWLQRPIVDDQSAWLLRRVFPGDTLRVDALTTLCDSHLERIALLSERMDSPPLTLPDTLAR